VALKSPGASRFHRPSNVALNTTDSSQEAIQDFFRYVQKTSAHGHKREIYRAFQASLLPCQVSNCDQTIIRFLAILAMDEA
jgi:hypothetical protein